jgi:dihydroxy-acid dehydratase
MAAGRYRGEDIDTTVLDAECWAYGVGKPRISEEELDLLENSACPGAGSCALLGTANTMQCLAEALGLTLPGAGTAPAVSAKRLWLAKESGRQIVRLVERDITSSKIITRANLTNAIRVLHAIGGSTNAVIHLLAIGYEMEFDDSITLELVEQCGQETPCIAAVRPSGPYTMEDFDEAGGIQAIMKKIEPMLNTDVLSVTGKTLGKNLGEISFDDSPVIRGLNNPVAKGGLAILRGNLARSAVVRPTVIAKEMMQHKGPARVFDSQEEAIEALRESRITPGDVIVVRYEGPKGGPGLTEVFKVIGYMRAMGLESKCALITDGKISGFARGPFICQMSPEAAEGGPLGVVEDGDVIEIDIPNRKLAIQLSKEELESRISRWKPPPPRVTDGFLTVYAKLANPVEKGAGINLRMK